MEVDEGEHVMVENRTSVGFPVCDGLRRHGRQR
jgi:hypothetical protein